MKKNFINIVSVSLMAMSSFVSASAESDAKKEKNLGQDLDPNDIVKCYGTAKAGKNDCGDARGKHGCAGMSTTDRDPCEWMAVKRSLCTKLKGAEDPSNCFVSKENAKGSTK